MLSMFTALAISTSPAVFTEKLSTSSGQVHISQETVTPGTNRVPKIRAYTHKRVVQPLLSRSIDSILTDPESYGIMPALIYGEEKLIYIPASEYLSFKARPHEMKRWSDYLNFLTPENMTIAALGQLFTFSRDQKNGTKIENTKAEQAAEVVRFVQNNVLYDAIIETEQDYIRFPVETLFERNGDCEDLAILAASIMQSIGIKIAIIVLPPINTKEEKPHAALGVTGNFEGKYYDVGNERYYYTELNGKTRKIGSSQSRYRYRDVILYIPE